MNKTTIAVALAAIASNASLASAAPKTLTAAEVQSLIIGHTMTWKSAKYKASGTTVYNPDGTMSVAMDGGKGPEAGKWRMKGDQLCDKTGKNPESCSGKIKQIDDKTFFFPTYQSTAVLQ